MFDLGERLKGDHVQLEVRFEDNCSPSGTVSLYLSRVDMEALQSMEMRLARGGIELSEFDDGYVKGTVNAEQGQILFTSIPYDEGWEVKVNGEKVKLGILSNYLVI